MAQGEDLGQHRGITSYTDSRTSCRIQARDNVGGVTDGHRLWRALPAVSLAAAAVFVIAIVWHEVMHQQLVDRAVEVGAYTELDAMVASYERACWLLLVVAIVALVGAAVSIRLVTRRRELWHLWALVAGSFVVYTAYSWVQAALERGVGGNFLVAANARPTSDHVSAVVDRAAHWPYPLPGAVGISLAVLLLLVHVGLVRGQLISGARSR